MCQKNTKTRKECIVTGKITRSGGVIRRSGKAKSAGGIGTHVTKSGKRKFHPNLQRKRIVLPNGTVTNAWVSTRALKAGLVVLAA